MRFAIAFLCAALMRALLLAVVIPFAWVAPGHAASAYQTSADKAVQWLVSQQASDGSWGPYYEEQFLLTSEVVRAFAAYQQKGSAYYAGITWLQNHNPINVDHHTRVILALKPLGESLTGNIAYLQNAQSLAAPGNGGWGVSAAYLGSAFDTALALEAASQVGIIGSYSLASGYLKSAQLAGASDKGWAVGNNSNSDPIATSLVVQALVPYRASDATLTTPIANAISTLGTQVTSTSPVAVQAQAVLALLRDNGASNVAANLLIGLTGSQGPNGDWNGDAYTTAVALRALSAAMQSDLAALAQRVDMPDQNLRAAINDALGRDQMSAISQGDMARLTSLDISGRAIANLTGMQYAINLTSLNAQNNQIASTAPLSGLTNLAQLLLEGNPVYVAGGVEGDVPTLPEWGAVLMAIVLIVINARANARRLPGGYA